MVFSSNIFLFAFLPMALAFYHATPKRWQNHSLFLLSSLFYVWGGGLMILLLYSYIGVNFYVGRRIRRLREQRLEPRVAVTAGTLVFVPNVANEWTSPTRSCGPDSPVTLRPS